MFKKKSTTKQTRPLVLVRLKKINKNQFVYNKNHFDLTMSLAFIHEYNFYYHYPHQSKL